MKKWFVLAAIVCVAVCGVQAKGGGETTKEQYVEAAKKKAEKAGKEFDQAKCEKEFDKKDKDGDGKLSAEEQGDKNKNKNK